MGINTQRRRANGTAPTTRPVGESDRKQPLGMPGPKYITDWPARQPDNGHDYGDHNAKSKEQAGF